MIKGGRVPVLVPVFLGLVLCLSRLEAGEKVAFIAQGGTTVGVQPELGGRIVYLARKSGPNLIPRSPRGWSWRPAGWPRPPLNYQWSQDFGAVVWVGPQDSWWTRQKEARQPYNPGWPPDPDWTLAAFRVLAHSSDRIVLQSPVSRLNGLQLTKTVECLPDGTVRLTTRVRNGGSAPVTRDIWFVFRAPFACEEFVPVRQASDVRLLKPGGSRLLHGFHTLLPPEKAKKNTFNKAYIDPAYGLIAVGYPRGFLLLEGEAPAKDRVSKRHAPIEVYRLREAGGGTLLELEQHSAAVRLRPGESFSATQYWRFLPYAGPSRAEAKSRFLAEHLHRCALPAR